MYRHSLLLGLCAAIALSVMAPLGAAGARTDAALLRKIASRLDDRTGVITIEASDPVPYVASQPDPRTFVIELRDVLAGDVAAAVSAIAADPRHPVASVHVESAQAADGAAIARVRLGLAQPQRPRVRSSRNVIYVEADRADRAPTHAGTVAMAGPSVAIRDLRVTARGVATAVTFQGTARLVATSVEEPTEGPRRVVLNFANVTTALPKSTTVDKGPVSRVRVGLDPKAPLMTQVTLDLSRAADYRLESSTDGNDLTVVFDEPSRDPVAAMAAGVPTAAMPAALQAAAAPQQPVPAPAPAATAPAAQAPPPAGTSRYSGHPISLDFQGVDLRAVLRTFNEISGLNIVIDPSIQGTVDVALRDVPWDQALDIILRANRLGYVVDGTIVRIAPLTVLAEEESQRRKLAEEQALAGELRVLTRSLSYARAEDLRALLTATVLSQRGSIQTDQRTNTLIINDLQDRLDRATALLTTLDRPEPQVEIEARIVQTTRDFARRLGVQWGMSGRATPALGNAIPLAFPNAASATTATNLGVSPAASTLALALSSINGALNLDLALSAVEESGQGRILSTPKIATQNNVPAEITQGVQIPIQTVANNTVTVSFRDAALTLKVTPQITAANTVIMQINVENAAPDFSRSVNNIPPIDTQRAVTSVLVADGETTVIGGIYISREQASQDRTPGLSRVPLLGWLFKRDEFSDESRELLIFITPRIVRL
jgi:type IV pilus assembly protein PilQ